MPRLDFSLIRFVLATSAVCAVAVTIAGCAEGGRDTTLERAPERVILFGPNLSATAVRLGHAERIVALTDYCDWPAGLGERPRVGGAIDPDLESIAALDPDLLVLQGESATLRSFAAAQGIAVTSVKMDDDVDSILRGIVTVDSLLGDPRAERGHALADTLRAGLDALARDVDVRPEVLLVVSREPGAVRHVLTAGRGTFLDDLLTTVGARNWGHDRGRGYFDVSLESLAQQPPDLVLEIVADPVRSGPGVAEEWARVVGPGVPVRRLVDPTALVPGPDIVRTARRLDALVHGAGELR